MMDWIILYHHIKIFSTFFTQYSPNSQVVNLVRTRFSQRLSILPGSSGRLVIPVAVVKEIRFVIGVFGRKAEGIVPSYGTRGADWFTKSRVFIVGGNRPVICIYKRHH